tara:strand:- start:1027 stop:2034 length:1008 start_codon:yes stop_codon:yes gene_type:complete
MENNLRHQIQNNNYKLHAPIEVTENESFYKVKIHYHDKEFVKAIEGRKWDSTEKQWLFEKNIEVYTKLKNEFQSCAKIFTITEPLKIQEQVNEIQIVSEDDDPPFDNSEIENEYFISSQENNKKEFLNDKFENLEVLISKVFNKVEEISNNKDSSPLNVNNESEKVKETNDIDWDDILKSLISSYQDDGLTKIMQDKDFSFKHYEKTMNEIQRNVMKKLRDLIPDKDYQKACINQWEFLKNRNEKYKKENKLKNIIWLEKNKQDYELTFNDLLRTSKKFINVDKKEPDPTKFLDCAKNIRNKLVHAGNENQERILIITYLLLTRMAWGKIDMDDY